MSEENNAYLPVIPLRNIIVFPDTTISIIVGREFSKKSIQFAQKNNYEVLLASQKTNTADMPQLEDIYQPCVMAKIIQATTLPDKSLKVLVEVKSKVEIKSYEFKENRLQAIATTVSDSALDDSKTSQALSSALKKELAIILENDPKINKEFAKLILAESNLNSFIHKSANYMPLTAEQKIKILSMSNIEDKAQLLLKILIECIEVLDLEENIRDKVKAKIDKNQKEYYLSEQLKVINKELKENNTEVDKLLNKIKALKMPKQAKKRAKYELRKIASISPSSPEYSTAINYVETLLALPWNKYNKIKSDISFAKEVLDKDHFGLEKVKDRILEYLATLTRVRKSKGSILCLVGPPGVGKTSLGRSIAKAMNRKYIRMALGGLKDESEIRGHRKTYIGSMPGQIINKLIKAKVNNPLFLLDEIDKVSISSYSDPSSALLEVLDPEQNKAFNDNYIEVDYDLSSILFVATANSLDIPAPLRDRMEIIEVSGYTETEKLAIASRYLVPKSIKESGLKANEINITNDAVIELIRYYTRESGVRKLKQEIMRICRKTLKNILQDASIKYVDISAEQLQDLLGPRKFDITLKNKHACIGQVTGMAWTQVGGDLLTIEAEAYPGKGKLKYTGQLGDIMKESIETAMTIVRKNATEYNIDMKLFDKKDIHIHVPEGATPKDGPSAGIAMSTVLMSALSGRPINSDIAMTGEITLSGNVLPIGGLKEKLLAATRGGIKKVLIPSKNKKDLIDMPVDIVNNLDIIPVNTIKEVFNHALMLN